MTKGEILIRGIKSLETELQKQTERAEKAEEENKVLERALKISTTCVTQLKPWHEALYSNSISQARAELAEETKENEK